MPPPTATASGAPEMVFAPVTNVIMQPTTLCNLDCTYCYLPQRRERLAMAPGVAKAVARALAASERVRGPVEIVWHGGEPTAAGLPAMRRLVDAFADLEVVHVLQTNATLINQEWIDFIGEHDIKIGVSIDGTMSSNASRIDLAGKETWTRTMRGIERLSEADIEFSAIAVVRDPDPAGVPEFYEFFASLGCVSLGINIEETEGVNTAGRSLHLERTTRFWEAVTAAWDRNPVLEVRELDRVADYLRFRPDVEDITRQDPIPTVAWNGEVTVLSPELAGYTDPRLGKFASGNILARGFDEILDRAAQAPWVREFAAGIAECARACEYFAFCGGGQASNKYWEHGCLDITRTDYCTGAKITLMEGVLAHARHRNPR
ncbi:cyclophane-forming radical SAM peptide maturase AmcB [Glycomyces sp. NPDC048151]|uniref:cyclophane-forming radical SAM peptide maturase AmcB n=1 Tax=Glycomyces sp. NPDC048151 TaxID=3364002 RepID=UPI00371C7459